MGELILISVRRDRDRRHRLDPRRAVGAVIVGIVDTLGRAFSSRSRHADLAAAASLRDGARSMLIYLLMAACSPSAAGPLSGGGG